MVVDSRQGQQNVCRRPTIVFSRIEHQVVVSNSWHCSISNYTDYQLLSGRGQLFKEKCGRYMEFWTKGLNPTPRGRPLPGFGSEMASVCNRFLAVSQGAGMKAV